MDDPLPVRPVESVGDLNPSREQRCEGHRAFREAARERLALDELHDEDVARGGRAGDFFEGIERRDPRMVQARERASLPPEPRPPLLIFEELFRQDLQSDGPVDARVDRPVHLAHPADAEQ